MTEAAQVKQVYNQTIGERSKLKNSAYHKKNGSAVAKLGNKRMSWQEIQSKHGKEETFPSTNSLITYSDFVRYPTDLKIEYVNKLMDKYDIDLQHISRYLFNKGDDGLRSYLRNNKLLNLCDYKKPRAKTGLLQFQADIEEWRRREKEAKVADDAEAQRKRDIIWNAEFITYEEFKALPIDGQVAYINNLIRKYSISLLPIATHLFNIDQGTLRDYLKRKKVYDQIEKSRSGNGKTGKIRIMEFDKAIAAWKGEPVVDDVKVEPAPEPVITRVPITRETDPRDIAADILRSIIGDEPEEKTVWDEMPETMEPEVASEPESIKTEEIAPVVKIEEGPMPAEDLVPEPEPVQIVEEPKKEETIENACSTVFTSNQRSVGLDSNWLKGLELIFKDKPIEVCITIRTI